MRKVQFLAFVMALFCLPVHAQDDRWRINDNGSITWEVKKGDVHSDHIEMSGLEVSTVIRYGVNEDGSLELNYGMVWPLLRTLPNDTHASLMRRMEWDAASLIQIQGRSMENEQVQSISLDGTMTIQSLFRLQDKWDVLLSRKLFPSTDKPAFLTIYTLENLSEKTLSVEIPDYCSSILTDKSKGKDGSYTIQTRLHQTGAYTLEKGERLVFYGSITGYKQSETQIAYDFEKETALREGLRDQIWSNLVLNTPDKTLNTMFQFAKIRGLESIYQTQGGLMHGPGGESYYAAIWANDQAEYINPFFPFTGYAIGNESALNSYRHFARFMNDAYEPIPSSIIAEGTDIWNGAGDRGDAAMIAYGASRYAMETGDKAIAMELWKLIEWCLEYCDRKLTKEGVVASDTDELENRFPSGKANLCTSSLYYDALLSAASLCKEIGKGNLSNGYLKRAKALRASIERHFGAKVQGFDTYRYYEGNDVLRAWICIPLTVGIHDRKDGTLDALFSDHLWTGEGLLSQSGEKTYWDRSTLYALRGALQSGDTKRAMEHLLYYSRHRLLGDHVPYAIEAWPEGSQRHLSAESGLYCRIITEGLFGIRPTGLSSFEMTPRLPDGWNQMELNHIRTFGQDYDIKVERNGKNLLVKVVNRGKTILSKSLKAGSTLNVRF